MSRIHLGCGNEILEGYTNLDSAALPGVDVVHNLIQYPWPFKDNEAEEILCKHVFEHLPDTIRVMEEIWRISKPGAHVKIVVPYWNASDFITDPTHIKAFNQHTFDFFNPDHFRCRERPYYSKARFRPIRRTYHFKIVGRYYAFRNKLILKCLEGLATYLNNIIQVIEFEMEAVKQ